MATLDSLIPLDDLRELARVTGTGSGGVASGLKCYLSQDVAAITRRAVLALR